jgi:cysteine desulfurase family protein (TIGR01976 family)
VPARVIEAVSAYLRESNANAHGAFRTSHRTDAVIESARIAMVDMLGAGSPREIAFGQNMTTLNFALSRAVARGARPGDEILVTEIDHQANIDPWKALAERGVTVREVRMDPDTCTLDLEDFRNKLSPRTLLVAVGWASNAVGTINNVPAIAQAAHQAGALVSVDAVHYAAHEPVDVQAAGCDFLLCSAYKFFGPHVGVLYVRPEAGKRLETYKVRPQPDTLPEKLETGTLNHEGLAGVTAAVDFIASLGTQEMDLLTGLEGRRHAVQAGMTAIRLHEEPLLGRFLEGASTIAGLKVYGPPSGHPRTPTVSFTIQGHTPRAAARFLGDRGFFVWDGDFYATTLVERLGLAPSGGLIRVGLAPYNTPEEVDGLLETLDELARKED